MFGIIRNILPRRSGGASVERPTLQRPASAAPPRSAAPLPSHAKRPAAPPSGGRGGIRISLGAVLAQLPDAARVKASRSASASFSIPMGVVTAQLRSGAVLVTYGQLRQWADDLNLPSVAGEVSLKLYLPLEDVLSQVPKEHYRCRSDQREVRVPDEVEALFGGANGSRVRVARDGGRSIEGDQVVAGRSAAPVVPEPIVEPETLSEVPGSADVREPVADETSVEAPGRGVVSQWKEPVPEERVPLKPSFRLPTPDELRSSTSAGKPAADVPGVSELREAVGEEADDEEVVTSFLSRAEVSGSGSGAGTEESGASAGELVVAGEFFELSGNDLLRALPEPLRVRVSEVLSEGSRLRVPLERMEEGLRAGRLEFLWDDCVGWLEPAAGDGEGPAGDEVLSLSLPVVVPLFLAFRSASGRAEATRRSVDIDEEIPDVFHHEGGVAGGSASASGGGDAAGVVEEPESVVGERGADDVVSAAVAPGAGAGAGSGTGAVAPGSPWDPEDLVKAAVRIGAVEGAIIVMHDGLPVASRLPDGLNSEHVAAFLPQAFERTRQLAEAAGMADSDRVTVVVRGQALVIYRTEKVFFAALCLPGQPAPEAQLDVVVRYLDPKRN